MVLGECAQVVAVVAVKCEFFWQLQLSVSPGCSLCSLLSGLCCVPWSSVEEWLRELSVAFCISALRLGFQLDPLPMHSAHLYPHPFQGSTHAHCPLHACLCVSVLQWGIYDAFKVAAGLPTTGAKAAAPAK